MNVLLNKWSKRNLSLMGRVTIIKSLALSKLQYLVSVLPMPPPHIIKDVQNKIYSFLWNNKNEKIRRGIMENTYEKGGLKVPNFDDVCNIAKISWVKRLIQTSSLKL